MDVELCVRILYDSHKYKKRVKCCDVNHKIYFTTYYGNECP